MKKDIQEAIRVLKNGGIVIFPTDTAFGIGCRIDDTKAVDRLFQLRNRPRTQATPVLVSSKEQALPYLDGVSDIVRHLQKRYWPGALTIISPCKESVYSPIRGGGKTIGFRMPDHSDVLQVIEAVGVPVLGPSANFHGEKTPFLFEDLDPKLISQVDFVLPGSCKNMSVSTVVDCSVDPYVIIRQGAVKIPKSPLILTIDSSKSHETHIAVLGGDQIIEKTLVLEKPSSDRILPLLESLLSEHNLSLNDISGIQVNVGPGSFTGLRVGAAIGMALGWLTGIPLNGAPAQTPLHFDYESDRWS